VNIINGFLIDRNGAKHVERKLTRPKEQTWPVVAAMCELPDETLPYLCLLRLLSPWVASKLLDTKVGMILSGAKTNQSTSRAIRGARFSSPGDRNGSPVSTSEFERARALDGLPKDPALQAGSFG